MNFENWLKEYMIKEKVLGVDVRNQHFINIVCNFFPKKGTSKTINADIIYVRRKLNKLVNQGKMKKTTMGLGGTRQDYYAKYPQYIKVYSWI